jgi:hypothetical protein
MMLAASSPHGDGIHDPMSEIAAATIPRVKEVSVVRRLIETVSPLVEAHRSGRVLRIS